MTIMQSKFKTFTRAAVIAIALGAAAVSAVPAMAQEAPQAFSLQLPGGQGGGAETFGAQRHGGGGWGGNHGGGWAQRCLTNREVRRGLADYGFRRVEVTRELRRDRVEVLAQYGSWDYAMRVDKCTGEVDRIERLRRGNTGGYNNGNGFGFQFNFGS
ncbi:hypothetical protein VW29_13270 [Devosia limi DSM 17137]|uniref:Peptidase propeptide and YPEB domain-containing protein n=1 Tax=Devosia limi DSM 17137 TaxID=1121477 RepID=A0A0F5LNJ3_9HYPH|nr:hypothetical protein [Devosia limi]KKB83674.1 hypothetical protein VW29_13270 [Devosia limi DSM 17137]SHE75178.1 hypothetical protein SAMN02745223_01087 [Devosia limi DSM 17137]